MSGEAGESGETGEEVKSAAGAVCGLEGADGLLEKAICGLWCLVPVLFIYRQYNAYYYCDLKIVWTYCCNERFVSTEPLVDLLQLYSLTVCISVPVEDSSQPLQSLFSVESLPGDLFEHGD